MSRNCTQSNKNGNPCGSPAMRGSQFCYNHDPQRTTRAANQNSRESTALELPSREELDVLVRALSAVYYALAEDRIDGSLAGKIITYIGSAARPRPARRHVEASRS